MAEQGSSGKTGAGPQVGTATAELISLTSPERTTPKPAGEIPIATQKIQKSIDALEGRGPNSTFTLSQSPVSEPPAKEAKRLYQQGLIQLDKSGNIKSQIKASVKNILKRMYEIVASIDNEKLEKKKGKGKTSSKIETRCEEEDKTTNKDLLEEIKAVKELIQENTGHSKKVIEDMGKAQQVILEKVKTTGLQLTEMKEEIGEDRNQIQEEAIKAITATRDSTLNAITQVSDCLEQIAGQMCDSTVAEKKTYAEAAKAPRPMFSLVVSSEDPGDSSHDVIKRVKSAVDAKTTGTRVDRIRRAKDAKVVIGCEEEEQIGRLKDRLRRAGGGLSVEERKNKDPLVILKDVMEDTDENIMQAVKTQNPRIFESVEGEEARMQVRYRKRTRNHLQVHVVMSVSPTLWTILVREGLVYVDLQRVKVQDQSPLVQCSRCLKFGHGKRLCTETEDLCSHCGQPHLRSECPSYKSANRPSCHNCALAKLENVEHNAFDEACPVRKRWDILARSSVAYC